MAQALYGGSSDDLAHENEALKDELRSLMARREQIELQMAASREEASRQVLLHNNHKQTLAGEVFKLREAKRATPPLLVRPVHALIACCHNGHESLDTAGEGEAGKGDRRTDCKLARDGCNERPGASRDNLYLKAAHGRGAGESQDFERLGWRCVRWVGGFRLAYLIASHRATQSHRDIP